MRTLPERLRLVHENANKKEQGAACCKHGDPSKATAPVEGDANMPFPRDYGDSTPENKPEPATNWQSLGELARKLAEKAAGK